MDQAAAMGLLQTVDLPFDVCTVGHECFERNGFVQEQAVGDHAFVIGSQPCSCIGRRYELQSSLDGCQIVDRCSVCILFAEEHAFVLRHGSGKFAILDGFVGKAMFIEPGHVVPVT